MITHDNKNNHTKTHGFNYHILYIAFNSIFKSKSEWKLMIYASKEKLEKEQEKVLFKQCKQLKTALIYSFMKELSHALSHFVHS